MDLKFGPYKAGQTPEPVTPMPAVSPSFSTSAPTSPPIAPSPASPPVGQPPAGAVPNIPNLGSQLNMPSTEDIKKPPPVGGQAVGGQAMPTGRQAPPNTPADNKPAPFSQAPKLSAAVKSGLKPSKLFIGGLITIAVLAGVAYLILFTPLAKYVGLDLQVNQATEDLTIGNNALTPELSDNETIPSGLTAEQRDEQRKKDLQTIKTALEAYYLATGKFSTATEAEKISDTSATGVLLAPNYVASIPQDPLPDYSYEYTSDGATYQLTARLENPSDPLGVQENGLTIYKLSNK